MKWLPFRRHRDRGPAPDRAGEVLSPEGSTASIAPRSSRVIFPSGIKLLYDPVDNALVDIVFVHGLTGHRENTWTAHDATEPWPKTLLPTKLPNARILTFGYDASVADWRSVVSEARVGNHASNLLNALANFREEDDTTERPIIFVCHSMGGLVCEDVSNFGPAFAIRIDALPATFVADSFEYRKALVLSRQRPEKHLKSVLHSTKGIVFLGTPHHGSGLAVWAEKLAKSIGVLKQTNTNIVQVLRRDSEVLARIQDSFHTMIQSRNRQGLCAIEITCFFEELPLPGVGLVVPQESAILPGYIPIGIRNNHQDMTKFVSLEDPGFKAVCAELRRWIKETKSVQDSKIMPLEANQNEEQMARGPQITSDKPKAHFVVPHLQNHDFVGRSDVLERLRHDFGHGPQYAKGQGRSRICLHGLGGVGKTQIAVAYTYWIQKHHPEISVFWVYASNADRFRQAFVEIANECDIAGHKDPSVDILALVKSWLQKKDHGPWFLVIDNADDTSLFFTQSPQTGGSIAPSTSNTGNNLSQFIPDCSHGSILVTTRNKQAGLRLVPGRAPIEVERMNDEESAQMIRTMSGDHTLSTEGAKALSDRLENLPLAIAQAAAFMQENSISIDRYLSILDKSDNAVVELLSQDFEAVGRDAEMPRAVMATWVVSFEQIKRVNPLASEVLSLMSFFDRQAILRWFIIIYLRGIPNRVPFANDAEIQTYAKRSGECSEGDGEDEEEEDDDDDDDDNDQKADPDNDKDGNYNDEEVYDEEDNEEVDSEVRDGDNHYIGVASYQDEVNLVKLEQALGILKAFSFISEGKNQSMDMHRLVQLATRGWLAKENSARQYAENALVTMDLFFPYTVPEEVEVFRKALPHAHAVLKNDSHDTPTTTNRRISLVYKMATLHRTLGQFDDALAILRKGLALAVDVLGERNGDVLHLMRFLVHILSELGRSQEAKQVLLRLMVLDKHVYPDGGFAVFESMRLLALLHRYDGEYEESRRLLVTALDESAKHNSSASWVRAYLMFDLSQLLIIQNELEEGEKTCVRAVELMRKAWGPNHPFVHHSLSGLVEILILQDRLQEAEAVCRQALMSRNVMSDNANVYMVELMRGLARVLERQNRLEEAIDIGAQLVEILMKIDGLKHKDTVGDIRWLSYLQERQGRWTDAEMNMAQTLEIYQSLSGSDDENVVGCMYRLACIKQNSRKYEAAKDLMEEAYKRHLRLFGPDDSGTNSCAQALERFEKEREQAETVHQEDNGMP